MDTYVKNERRKDKKSTVDKKTERYLWNLICRQLGEHMTGLFKPNNCFFTHWM